MSTTSSDDESSDDNAQQQQQPSSHVTVDCHYLCAFDPSPSPHLIVAKRPSRTLIADDANAVQTLIDALFSLPSSSDEPNTGVKKIVMLPDTPIVRLPRHKPVPQPKPETRWETFAREKGIQKKKRDRLVYDKNTDEYLPRFGTGRSPANNPPIIEIKSDQDPNMDPFEKLNLDKRMQKLKQRSRELKNEERAQEEINTRKGRAATTGALDFMVPETKRGQKRTLQALKHVQIATASHGRFDHEVKDEPKKNVSGEKRRKYESNTPTTTSGHGGQSNKKRAPSLEDEKARNLKLLERMKR